MANLDRYEVVWQGIGGLPGLSVFYCDAGANVGTDLTTFFGVIKDRFPVGTSWVVPNSGDTIDDATGTLVGGWSGTGGGTTSSGASSAAYAAGTGAIVRWNTAAIVGGRRLRGRTFLCPLLASQYDTSGVLTSGWLSALATAAAGIVTAADFRIWHRPTPGGSDGSSSGITSFGNPSTVSSLRSRRV